jgi:hypothetical protein
MKKLSKTINLQDISLSQAKRVIKRYFEDHHGKIFDAADIQENLGIPIEIAIQALDDLEIEKQIEEKAR